MSINAPAASHAVDGLTPRSIAEPSSVDELCAALHHANERGQAVIPWGAGLHMSLGNAPARYDIALRTAKLDRVVEHEPADLMVTVECGTTMGRLQSLLAGHGQFLPIDAPAEATVGGVLAAGLSGPSRHAYGLPRDWLIGCRLALADGTLVKCGGRVVKNVAGYDLQKLVIGSLGTLGVIVEATFKVAPLPVAQETLAATFESLDGASAAVRAADERSLALRAVAVRQPGATALFWLAGPRAAVERSRGEIEEICRSGQAERVEDSAPAAAWELAGGAGGVTIRASLLPSQVPGLMSRIERARTEPGLAADALAYPTTGLVVAHVDQPDRERLAAFVESTRGEIEGAGGSLVVTSAPPEAKRRLDVWGPSTLRLGSGQAGSGQDTAGSALPLMRRLKEQFDPRGTLNPGRFMGGI